MPRAIRRVLAPADLAAIRAAAEAARFEGGKATAGRLAREGKNNAQAQPSPELDALLKRVTDALLRQRTFASAARPKQIAGLLLSRYEPGQAYDTHVDDAIMRGRRTDLSFTLFLTPPDDYDGGALVLEDPLEARHVKLAAGDAILYPSGAPHRVEPVTRGRRLAVVGWVTSWVRDPARREILFDLDHAIDEAYAAHGPGGITARLQKTRANLTRMWVDD